MRREGQRLVQIVGRGSSQRGRSPGLLQKLLPPPEAKPPTGRLAVLVPHPDAGRWPGEDPAVLAVQDLTAPGGSVLGLLAHRQGEASFQTQDPSPLLCPSAVW